MQETIDSAYCTHCLDMTLDSTDLTGSLICDRYRVIARVGEGAMGTVYHAEDMQLRREVALKVLRKEWGERAEIRQRLENECRILARLAGHPNVVTLYDRVVHDDSVILVMEFVRGETLSEVLHRTRSRGASDEFSRATMPVRSSLVLNELDTPSAIAIAKQSLDAIEYAHNKGILHRDIKPGNILLTTDFEGRIVAKIMDFGIAKALLGEGETDDTTSLTRAGAPGPGTPAYMAPEQIDPRRFGRPGRGVDIYAFGVTLYEMLTLCVPFEGTYTELLHQHTNVEPPDPRRVNPDLGDELRDVLLRSLRKAPAERYGSANEFRSSLIEAWDAEKARKSHSRFEDIGDAAGSASRLVRAGILAALILLGVLILAGGTSYLVSGTFSFVTPTTPAPPAVTPPAAQPKPPPTIAPSATIMLSGLSPTGADSVDFSVSVNESWNSEITSDAVTVTGSLASGSTVAVTGARPTYTVTVYPGDPNADGEIGIALPHGVVSPKSYSISNEPSGLQQAKQAAETARSAAIAGFEQAHAEVATNYRFNEGTTAFNTALQAHDRREWLTAQQYYELAAKAFSDARPADANVELEPIDPQTASMPVKEPVPELTPINQQPATQASADQARQTADSARERAVERFKDTIADHEKNEAYKTAAAKLLDGEEAAKQGDFNVAETLYKQAAEQFDAAKPPPPPAL